MASDYSIKGYTGKCADGVETVDVWKASPEAAAATRPVMEKRRELEGTASFKGNLFRPVFSYNFSGYPRHHPINLAAFPQRHVDFDMHSIEPGYGFPIHLHDYADESYMPDSVTAALPAGCGLMPGGGTSLFHRVVAIRCGGYQIRRKIS